eukprot:5802276-Alexandrium_andersonii.AAC.1
MADSGYYVLVENERGVPGRLDMYYYTAPPGPRQGRGTRMTDGSCWGGVVAGHVAFVGLRFVWCRGRFPLVRCGCGQAVSAFASFAGTVVCLRAAKCYARFQGERCNIFTGLPHD